MESLVKPVNLTQDVSRVLDEIRAGAENALYCAGPDVAGELFAKHIVSLIEGAGLPVLQTMHYRWFLRELARLWRTRTGRDLAFHLELCIRKWVGLGLEPRTLQFLVTEAHERLKAQSLATKARNHEEVETTAKDAKGGDMTETCPEVSDRVPSPQDSTTKTPSHQENPESSPAPDPSSPIPTSYDARMCQPMSGPRPPSDPDTGILESSNPRTLPGDSSNPGVQS